MSSFNDKKIVILTDTFSTGACMASQLSKSGFHVIACLSAELGDLLDMVPQHIKVDYLATIVYDTNKEPDEALSEMISKIKSLGGNLIDVIAGAETGVLLADRLSESLGLRSNGTLLSEARRNKFVMGETIRSAGIRAVKQLRASSWEEINSWITEWNPSPFKLIVKPLNSAGSDSVTLCINIDEVMNAFTSIMGKHNHLGLSNCAVLVQEFLEGTEYVIDSVSRDGDHKIIAIWEYDRRPVNGANFVCFGQRLMIADEDRVQELVAYQKKVLTALNIVNGASHGEIKWFKDEPVLVEVGARCHGAEGCWIDIEDKVYGYNQAQVNIDCYINPEAYNLIPYVPTIRKGYGSVVFIVVKHEGYFKEVNPIYLDEIKSMKSCTYVEFFLKQNRFVPKTIDCFTWVSYYSYYYFYHYHYHYHDYYYHLY